ncbi:sensor histidine kinase [Microbacterium sp. GXF7504]
MTGADEATDRRIMVSTLAVLVAVIAVFTSLQSVMVLGAFSHSISGSEPVPWKELVVRISVNLVGGAVLVFGVILVRPEHLRILPRSLAVVGLALGSAAVRGMLQATTGVYDPWHGDGLVTLVIEALTTATILVLAQVVGLIFVALWRRARSGERMRSAAQDRALHLLRQLQEEELRVRREIAETIHGSVQGVFVVLEAQLRRVAAGDGVDDTARAELDGIAGQLGTLREHELRALSARLYPVDLARGTDAALRTLLARLPAWVSVHDDASETLADLDGRLSLEAKVVIVRVAEEAFSNALRHGGAQAIRVTASVDAGMLTLALHSDGVAPPADAVPSGIARLGRRAEVLGGDLTLAPGDGGGATLLLRVPLR